MNCKRCKGDINIFKPPFGVYFCKKNHVQCAACELISSICVRCGEETKYKSPHFLPEKDFSPMSKSVSELQIPTLRDITPTVEEENEFRRLRLSFLNGEIDEAKCFRGCNEVNSVRTLSAMIAKDLPVTNGRSKTHEAECDFRFQKIMRALGETGYPKAQRDNDSDEDDQMKQVDYKTDYNSCSQLKILYPQESQLRASVIRLTSSSSSLSKITVKSIARAADDKNDSKSDFDKSENGSLNWGNFKTISCLNLVETPPTGFPISIEEINLDRHPFCCPISNCVGKLFVSDFNHHIIHDHPMLPLSKLNFGEFKELLIDVKLCTWTPCSIACFLMMKIAKNFSAPPLTNALPMILMIGRYRFKENTETFDYQSSTVSTDEPWTVLDSLVIWLIGIVPEQCDIVVGISIYSKTDAVLTRWFVDHLNSIQSPTKIEDVFQTARRLILSFREVKMLTNDFQDTLLCQIGLVNYVLKDTLPSK